jgi:WD40 repeat protein
VWNAATGQLLAILEGHTGAVENAAFSPDNQFIVTSNEANTPRVYQLITLSDIASLLRR